MLRGIFIIFLLLSISSNAQNKQPFFPFTQAAVRAKTKHDLLKLVDSTLKIPFSDTNYSKWRSAFWAMEIMLYKSTEFKKNIPFYLKQFKYINAELQWSFLEALYTLYPGNYAQSMMHLLQEAKTNKIKALILEYLYLGKMQPKIAKEDSFRLSPYYKLFLSNRTNFAPNKYVKKSLLTSKYFLPNQIVLVSFQYKNRNQPGYLMIRTTEGKWLQNKHDKPNRFKQLARSITNMPYYLTNGNTPQGLYKITGLDSSSNNWIGPTTNLQMVMPFEETQGAGFFSKNMNEQDKYRFYQTLLGPLSNIESLWQSYHAGKVGRTEIIAHGTTIPPSFYAGKSYFPCTPSLGCLCSPEIWNEQGILSWSAQAEWISIIKKQSQLPSYLLVIEIE